MKVILMSDLRHRGRRGQVVEVKPGFARNFLFPQGLALVATPGNLKRFEHEKKKIDARHDAEREAAAAIAAQIAGLKLTIAKRATETGALYGSVTASEVVDAMAAKESRSIAVRWTWRGASRPSAITRCASTCTPRWSPSSP